jgi:hypothetical protein
MKVVNERKKNILQRLIDSILKLKKEKNDDRSESPPVEVLTYQLPTSFFKAVNEARLEAGYDILPHFHNLSVSQSTHRKISATTSTHRSKNDHQTRHKHVHFSSTSDNDKTSSNKGQSRKHSHHHHHKKVNASHRQPNTTSISSAD